MDRLIDAAAALASVGAGIYLLSKGSEPITVGGQTGQSWLEILAHGIGVYFIARGVAMFRAAEQRRDQIRAFEKAAAAALSRRGE